MLYVEDFAGYLKKSKHSSANTIASYMRDLKKFAGYIAADNSDFLTVSNQTVSSYITFMQSQGQAVSSVLRSIASLRAFYRYLVDSGKVKSNPLDGVQSPKLPERNISVLTSKETDLLLLMQVVRIWLTNYMNISLCVVKRVFQMYKRVFLEQI